jgi:micrococcal nuclease
MNRPSSSCFPAAITGFMLGVLVLGTGGPVDARGQSFTGTVHDVLDGDTVHLLRETGQIVRMDLYGLDAPELGQPYGQAAAQALRRAVFQKRVRAVAEGDDEDGRPLFVLYANGDPVNEQLIRDGLAWWDRRRAASEDRLRRLEHQARAAERGLWVQSNPVPPWEWRVRRRR